MNPGPEQRRIYGLAAVYVLLVVAACVAPRVFKDPAGGIDAALTAVTIFAGVIAVAGLVAMFLFVRAWRSRSVVSPRARVIGLLPLPVTVVGLLAFVAYLRTR